MMKRLFAAVLCITLFAVALTTLVFADNTVTATLTTSKVTVNGKNIAFGAYNINGNNYFKLRDLAFALNGTTKQFDIEYDAAKNAITMISDKAYTKVGGEMAAVESGKKTATKSSAKIYIDDSEVTDIIEAYNIGGNNYFKLRDLGELFRFSVDYDSATNTIVIDTSKTYMSAHASPYEDLTKEQRLEMLGYDAWDVGNPWRPYSGEYVYGFLAWYVNDQYGLNITAEDVTNAVREVTAAADYDEIGIHPLAELSRLYHVCVQYELYPSQEMRENMDESRWTTDDYLVFGENPKRAKGDSDSIDDYYESND